MNKRPTKDHQVKILLPKNKALLAFRGYMTMGKTKVG